MLRYNSFRAQRYLRSRFNEGKYLLASEASDIELEVMDDLRQTVRDSVGDVSLEDAFKVEWLSITELLVKPGNSWYDGLPLKMRGGKDQLVSGSVLTTGLVPVGVTMSDDSTGLGKVIKFNDGATTPTANYRIVITAEEQVITFAEDPFIKNANLSETTAQKIRLLLKINVVLDSAQTDSPVPYTNDTSNGNLTNKVVVTPTAAGNGELISSSPVPGSEEVDGRDLELIIRNDPGVGSGRVLPAITADQLAFANGSLVDSNGTTYHLNAIFNDVVGTQLVLRIDKEANQIDPVLTNTVPYTVIKSDVYVTDNTNGTPQGKIFYHIAKANWQQVDGFVHDSVVEDLRSSTIPAEEFQNKAEQKFGLGLGGGAPVAWDDSSELFTWGSAFSIVNPYGFEQSISANTAAVLDGGSLVYDMDLDGGGVIGLGNLAVTVSVAGTTTTLSGSPNLSSVRLGNIIKDSAGNLAKITAVDDVNDQLTVSPALVAVGSAVIYRDSFSQNTAPRSVDSFTLLTRKDNRLYHNGALLALLYSSNIRGIANEMPGDRLGALTDAVGDEQEDRSAFLRSDSLVGWDGTQVSFPSDIILHIVNTKSGTKTEHTVSNSNSPFALADGESAWVEISRTATSETVTLNLSNTLAVPAQVQNDKDVFILFTRVNAGPTAYLHIPLHKQLIEPGDSRRLGTSASTIINAPVPIIKTGILAAGSTTFAVGSTFDLNAFSGEQIGNVAVYADASLMLRNVGNVVVASGVDGDYYEVDAGGGLSSTIEFNFPDTKDRTISIIGFSNVTASQTIIGPTISTDKNIVRFVGVNGNRAQDSKVNISDSGLELQLNTDATATADSILSSGNDDGSMQLVADPSADNGGNVQVYGPNHGSKAGLTEIKSDSNTNIEVDNSGNVDVQRGHLQLSAAGDPGATTEVRLGGQDSTDSGTPRTLSLRAEQAAEATATFTQTHRLRVFINGVEYYISLDQV